MLILLAVFGLVAALLPLLRRWIGNGVFLVGAATAAVGVVVTAMEGPVVLAGGEVRERLAWLPQIGVDVELRVDALSWVMALAVTGVGTLVLLYCSRYFKPAEADLGRFAGVLLAFAGVMYGLVVADNAYVMFMFWEATSVFSYLLVGHYTGRRASRGAAMQALLVTTLGGLVMLIGLVILHATTGSPLLSAWIAAPPAFDGAVIAAIACVVVGIMTKSALVPFHFWLPGAMAAPTPVSSYLHAAAMVKAGIYLVVRFAPGFADMPGWREALVSLGVLTMLVGGWRALRQHDLKLILAYGTVSQLGFLAVVTSFGTREAALAGLALLVAHACFKATLFLSVGIIDHRTGTRDIRKLSGLGRSAPVLAGIVLVALASMSGLPPTLGFVAKEAVLTAFLQTAMPAGGAVDPWGWVALCGVLVGSCLTVAYSLRLFWGAFARKRDVETVAYVPEHFDFLAAPMMLAIASLGLGLAAPVLDPVLALAAEPLPAADPAHPYHLALWHGPEPALFLSAGTLLVGALLFAARRAVAAVQEAVPAWIDSSRGYWAAMEGVDLVAARATALTQRGSLPFYLGSILVVFVASSATTLLLAARDGWPALPPLEFTGAQLVVAVLVSVAAIAATVSRKRFQGVVLVGVTGYGMALTFALHGAPDLAITQALIETITLVVFVLVLRRLPATHEQRRKNPPALVRWSIGIGVGLAAAALAVFAISSRRATPDSIAFPELAFVGGHGENIVNVTLVDLRGWDTMGELSVLIAAATGVASLIYINTRNSVASATTPTTRPLFRFTASPITEAVELPTSGFARAARDGRTPDHQKVWLLAGRSLAPENRSIMLEVVVRLVFHGMLVTSLYFLFVGHNAPGGGFAGGIIAGLALAARYLAGGRAELDLAVRIDAGRLLGIGLLTATLTALVPLFFGAGPLTSTYVDEQLPFIGQFVFVTSTLFDIGVYLIVIALVIDILRSLGGAVDAQALELPTSSGASDDGELQVTPLGSHDDHPVVAPDPSTRPSATNGGGGDAS